MGRRNLDRDFDFHGARQRLNGRSCPYWAGTVKPGDLW
jgi:hypothetical protein